MNASEIYAAVGERYSAASADPSQLSEGYGRAVARAFGYSDQELAGIPAESNLGLSCGNPLAIASLREVGNCCFIQEHELSDLCMLIP